MFDWKQLNFRKPEELRLNCFSLSCLHQRFQRDKLKDIIWCCVVVCVLFEKSYNKVWQRLQKGISKAIRICSSSCRHSFKDNKGQRQRHWNCFLQFSRLEEIHFLSYFARSCVCADFWLLLVGQFAIWSINTQTQTNGFFHTHSRSHLHTLK
jgi:hypothetical protein